MAHGAIAKHLRSGRPAIKRGAAGWRYHPFEVSISGFKGSGKTTLIASLINELAARGVSCGFLKHDAHRFDMDYSATDTAAAYGVGASRVAIRDHEHLGLIARGDYDQVVMEQSFLLDDLLFIEGNKANDLPKIFLLDPRGEGGITVESGSVDNLIAVAGELDQLNDLKARMPDSTVPLVDRNDISTLLELLEADRARRVKPPAALLLAGGKSSRMGVDKAGIRYRGVGHAEYMAKLLSRVTDSLFLSVDDHVPVQLEPWVRRGTITVLRDRFKGMGPMGGILTAFAHDPARPWLVAAVDLPFVEESDLRNLERIRDPLKFATCFGTPLPEPLLTIYEPKTYPRMLALAGRGVDCPRGFLKESPIICAPPPRESTMMNANSPEDRSRAIAELGTRGENLVGLERENFSTASSSGRGDRAALPSVAAVDDLFESLRSGGYGRLLACEEVPLDQAGGRVLAENVTADRDQPPFHRAAMDGIAVSARSLVASDGPLRVRGVLAAGDDPRPLAGAVDGECIEIMTGASLPEGYDAVVRYEDVQISDGRARVEAAVRHSVVSGANIHRRGSDYEAGESLLREGVTIDSTITAVLATVGATLVSVRAEPRVAVVSTGSELVGVHEHPLDHQIRESNVHALSAELRAWGIPVAEIRSLPDDERATNRPLRDLIRKNSVVVLSGGVSKGKFDFVPGALMAAGVEIRLHGVAQKPGKPLLVGTHPSGTLVVALPGNPVSALVNLRRYLVPFLAGDRASSRRVELEGTVKVRPGTTLFPAVRVRGGQKAEPVSGNGSGDFFHLVNSTGFVEVADGFDDPGTLVDYFAWGGSP